MIKDETEEYMEILMAGKEYLEEDKRTDSPIPKNAGTETDREGLITEDVALVGDEEAMPKMNRRRLKAQKFTYYKLVFK